MDFFYECLFILPCQGLRVHSLKILTIQQCITRELVPLENLVDHNRVSLGEFFFRLDHAPQMNNGRPLTPQVTSCCIVRILEGCSLYKKYIGRSLPIEADIFHVLCLYDVAFIGSLIV